MKTTRRFAIAISGLFAAGTLSLGTSVLGCAAVSSAANCTSTSYITPSSATLDHSQPGNAQQFSLVTTHTGGCPISNVVIGYTWIISDTVDATVSTTLGSSATVSCTNAALNPITVFPAVASFPPGSGPSTPPTYIPSGFSATLLCK